MVVSTALLYVCTKWVRRPKNHLDWLLSQVSNVERGETSIEEIGLWAEEIVFIDCTMRSIFLYLISLNSNQVILKLSDKIWKQYVIFMGINKRLLQYFVD